MKIVQINTNCGSGSTGKICVAISKLLTEQGIENYILYTSGVSDYPLGIKYANKLYIKLQSLKSHISGNYGFESKGATKRLIKHLERIKPDIIHLHNLHGHNVNVELLFQYIKDNDIKVIWTFHDCWAFTGYCPHFIMAKCDKWKTGCNNCPQFKKYSFFFDHSEDIFNKKSNMLEGIDLTIVTPSQWLVDLVGQSFFKDVNAQVINNGINMNIFKPTESNFRSKYDIPKDKCILLGVAFDWGLRKGLDVFIELSTRLENSAFQIVLVGTNQEIDKQLPYNIISIHRTQDQIELAEIYSESDIFINPTREEALGLVNIEANACGTPVITYRTGGSPECLNENSGSVVDCDDIDGLEREIRRICSDKPYSKDSCVDCAKQFNEDDLFRKYIDLYQEIASNK